MPRHVAPGNPPAIDINLTNVKMPDFKELDALGDTKIKAANQNFKLYADTLIKTESAKLYEQYKNDPIQLANALDKLPGILKGLPEEIQDDMNARLYLNGTALVQKAEDNRQRLEEKQAKANALKNANDTNINISTDFFNILKNMTAAPEDQMPIYNNIYVANRMHLRELADSIDKDGKYLFTETQRKAMQMPKEASVAGFSQFINRFELKQLQDWDKEHFQNKEEFQRKTLIDDETYESMEKVLTARLKALADDKVRQIHGQAFYDAAALITEPIQVNIDRAKTDGIISNKTIDKIVKASTEATKNTYAYDPTRKTSPGAFMRALADFTTTINNDDWSPEGREKAIGEAADSLIYLSALAKETNMSPELVDTIKEAIKTTITNKEAAEALDLSSAQFKNNVYNYSGNIDYTKFGQTTLATSGAEKAKKLAAQNFEANILNAINTYIQGDLDKYKSQAQYADLKYKLDSLGFMPFSQQQWMQWQKDVETGKEVVLEYMGNSYRFNGFDSQKPLTLLNMI